jgi:hypothetical protein
MLASVVKAEERFLASLGKTAGGENTIEESSCGNLSAGEACTRSGFQRTNAIGESRRSGVNSGFAGIVRGGFLDFSN